MLDRGPNLARGRRLVHRFESLFFVTIRARRIDLLVLLLLRYYLISTRRFDQPRETPRDLDLRRPNSRIHLESIVRVLFLAITHCRLLRGLMDQTLEGRLLAILLV